MNLIHLRLFVLGVTLFVTLNSIEVHAADWSIPMAGNAYRTAPKPGGRGFRRKGSIAWSDKQTVFSTYFHVDRACDLLLKVRASLQDGESTLEIKIDKKKFPVDLKGKDLETYPIGNIKIEKAGYVRVDFVGLKKTGKDFGEISDLVVSSETKDLKLSYVKTNKGGMFYWGRRGPSVHLSYNVPRKEKLKYAYSEITVPKGEDPIGTFYMANGFGQGYFGIQVNSSTERRVLFSVWSPFKTDNPREVPKEYRIVSLGSGPGVHVGKFGNEGSGGQSYLKYLWKAGVTYRFLTEVKPDGKGNTIYTAWFGEKAKKEWRLIASFRRPKTDTHLRGFHSFLESFSPSYGYIGRRALYGNVWVRDTQNRWYECTKARFSVDATGGGRHRLDFTGGKEGKHFFLRNCGFFNETGKPGERFTRKSTAKDQPKIDFDALPRGK